MKWTILFVIHGLDEGLQEQSRVLKNVISYGNWSLKYINLLYLKSEIVYEGRQKKYNAVLKRVSTADERRKGKQDVTVVKRFPNINIGSKDRMAEVFRYVGKNYPSQWLMLATFDHGAGFGVFDPIPKENRKAGYHTLAELEQDITDDDKQEIARSVTPAFYYQYKTDKGKNNKNHSVLFEGMEGKEGQLRYYGKKYAATDMLTMEELATCIRSGFGRKVDVMLLVNCNMQMVETTYTLRDTVNYLVASESLFWVYGINYREVIWQMDNVRSLTPAKVAFRCVKTMPDRYKRIFKLNHLNDVSFSALHVEKMTPLFQQLDELFGSWLQEKGKYMKQLGKARKAGADLSQFNYTKEQREAYEPLFFYDLVHLLKCMAPRDERVKNIIRLFESACINRYIGSDFRKRGKSIVNGMSIYFPFEADDFGMKYFDLFYRESSEFMVQFAATNWGHLIREIKKQAES